MSTGVLVWLCICLCPSIFICGSKDQNQNRFQLICGVFEVDVNSFIRCLVSLSCWICFHWLDLLALLWLAVHLCFWNGFIYSSVSYLQIRCLVSRYPFALLN